MLKAMNRQHTAEDYLRLVDRIRTARPDIALASDFIVGFPGESQGDFEDTLALARSVGFAQAYSFKYSPRPGTPAADMSLQVSEDVKEERLQRLQELIRDQARVFNQATVGRRLKVLFTRDGKRAGQALGYSPWMQPVHVENGAAVMGRMAEVEIRNATPSSLGGHVVNVDARSEALA